MKIARKRFIKVKILKVFSILYHVFIASWAFLSHPFVSKIYLIKVFFGSLCKKNTVMSSSNISNTHESKRFLYANWVIARWLAWCVPVAWHRCKKVIEYEWFFSFLLSYSSVLAQFWLRFGSVFAQVWLSFCSSFSIVSAQF